MYNSEPCSGDSRNSKRLLTLLLSVSCLAAIVLLVTLPAPARKLALDADRLDYLIRETFDQFQIPEEKIRIQTLRPDSVMVRKVYTLSLPPWVSGTQWHYELHKKILPYGATAPARVQFPGEEMNIHVVYGPNVVRTIRMRNDPDDYLLTH